MFDKDQFSQLVHDTLISLGSSTYSLAAIQLLLGTAAQESGFGTYLKQIQGPALGVFQMEPGTEQDIWEHFLKYRPHIRNMIIKITGVKRPDPDHLRGNLLYQIIMARLHYYRVPEILPASDDVPGMASYWKRFYNTKLGRGAEAEFVENYHRYIGDPSDG